MIDQGLGVAVGIGVVAFVLGAAVRGLLNLLGGAIHDETEFTLGSDTVGVEDWLVDHVVMHPFVVVESSESEIDGITILTEEPATGLIFLLFTGFIVVACAYVLTKRLRRGETPVNGMKLAGGVAVGYAAMMLLVAAAFEAAFEIEVSGLFGSRTQSLAFTADPLTALVAGAAFGGLFGYAGIKIDAMGPRRARLTLIAIGSVWGLVLLLGLAAGPPSAAG